MSDAWRARALSFCVGFLSLSQEILLVRLVGFAYFTTPKAFSFVLLFFLLGIAIGAAVGKLFCARASNLWRGAAVVLGIAGLVDVWIPYGVWVVADNGLVLACVVLIAAALKSVAFPIAHHLGSGVPTKPVGISVSRVYFANIMGSALGPLVTGFILLQVLSLAQCLILVGAGTLALAAACAGVAGAKRWSLLPAAFCVASAGGVAANPPLIEHLIDPSQSHRNSIGQIVENRSGIIHTLKGSHGVDATFGGNVYDGMINTNLRTNENMIHRVYVLAALHPKPKRALVVGLSSGAWTWIVARLPDVEHVDVVEINAGYLQVIEAYPQVSSILTDPRIKIHIDDGRRWLRRNPHARYDLVVMNTTFYWRAFSTNLLSVEFLKIVRDHMSSGGVLTFNTTALPDAYETTSRVFPFVFKYEHFAYASDHDFVATLPDLQQRVWQISNGGEPIFNPMHREDQAAIDRMFAVQFLPMETVRRFQERPLEIITDDNMIPEYKFGKRSYLIPFLD